jgi:flagellar assembly protein FliH
MPPAPERRRARVLRGQEADAAGRAAMGLTGLESPDGFHGMIDAKLVERVMTQAREAGFQTGYAEGITQAQAAADAARAEAERRIARACAAVGAAAGELATRETASVEAVEDEVAAIAFELARAILGRELEVATAPGAAAVARALSLAPPRQPVTVRLHPDDLAVLGDPAALAPGREVIAIPDPSVTPGGCLVESGGALIDARVEPALERVRQAMLG